LPGKVGGLTVADALTARVLQGGPFWLMGPSATGKSLWLDDFRHYLAGGQFNPGAESSGDCYMAEVLIGTQSDELGFDKQEKIPGDGFQWKSTGRHNASMLFLDEILHAIGPVQGALQGVTQGRYNQHGLDLELGKEGYFLCGVTSNDPRDTNYNSTNDASFSLYDRFPFILNLGSQEFGPTEEDRKWIELLNPGTSSTFKGRATSRNVMDKVITASKIISSESVNLGVEAEAAFAYLNGLAFCPGKDDSGKKQRKDFMEGGEWPVDCSGCSRDTTQGEKGDPLCRQLTSGSLRMFGSMKGYASALDFMAKLKNKWRAEKGKREIPVESSDLVFAALELCAGHSHNHGGILKDQILRESYHNREAAMTRALANRLRADYGGEKDKICSALEAARNGRTAFYFTNLFQDGEPEQICASVEVEEDLLTAVKGLDLDVKSSINGHPYEEIKKAQTLRDVLTTRPLEFEDNREVPLGHIEDTADFTRKNFQSQNHDSSQLEGD
jgi:hypothetical protein